MNETQEYLPARIRLEEDGTLSNKRVEQYVLLRADEVSADLAWRLTSPKKNSKSDGGNYRANVHKNKNFKERLEYLVDRRAELLAKGIWGQIQWQAEQMYATARATNDHALMTKATDMLLKVAEKTTVPDDAPPAADKPEKGRGRGAPVADNPQVHSDPAAVRQKLMDMGRKHDPEDEDDDDET